MYGMSTIRKDFVASNLRSQLDRLQGIINNIEESSMADFNNADLSLREIELGLRRIRKVCSSNN